MKKRKKGEALGLLWRIEGTEGEVVEKEQAEVWEDLACFADEIRPQYPLSAARIDALIEAWTERGSLLREAWMVLDGRPWVSVDLRRRIDAALAGP